MLGIAHIDPLTMPARRGLEKHKPYARVSKRSVQQTPSRASTMSLSQSKPDGQIVGIYSDTVIHLDGWVKATVQPRCSRCFSGQIIRHMPRVRFSLYLTK
jgi:hypothetical protein